MKKLISDGDLLNGMLIMLDYEPVVYGHSGHYYNTNLFATKLNEFDEHSLDETEGSFWADGAFDENKLEEGQIEYLKNALWLYNY